MRNPYICGKNRISIPTSGCSDCDALEYRIEQLEEWRENMNYSLEANLNVITLVGSDGTESSVEVAAIAACSE